MDLLIRLGEKVNFTFTVRLSSDGSYGSLRRVSSLLRIILFLTSGEYMWRA
jgi:hypothetical protein